MRRITLVVVCVLLPASVIAFRVQVLVYADKRQLGKHGGDMAWHSYAKVFAWSQVNETLVCILHKL